MTRRARRWSISRAIWRPGARRAAGGRARPARDRFGLVIDFSQSVRTAARLRHKVCQIRSRKHAGDRPCAEPSSLPWCLCWSWRDWPIVFLLPGLSVARQEPSKLEVSSPPICCMHSVPAEAAAKANPLMAQPDAADIRAGHDLFTAECETCHAYDGGGRTEIGGGAFPRPPVLKVALHVHVGRRDFLSYPQRHPEHGDAGLEFPGPPGLAAGAYMRHLPIVVAARAAGCRRSRPPP